MATAACQVSASFEETQHHSWRSSYCSKGPYAVDAGCRTKRDAVAVAATWATKHHTPVVQPKALDIFTQSAPIEAVEAPTTPVLAVGKVSAEVLCGALAAVYGSLTSMAASQSAPQRLTRFHSKVVPGIGIELYMQRVWQYFKCSDACHVLALIYIDRLVKLHPDFAVTDLTVHRLLAAATVIGAKYLDDLYFANSYYAKVCGLSLRELNALEANFVSLIRWKLNVTEDEFNAYFIQVMKATGNAAKGGVQSSEALDA